MLKVLPAGKQIGLIMLLKVTGVASFISAMSFNKGLST